MHIMLVVVAMHAVIYDDVKPRNLNQKRTQTRPKAVGTICPSDVAGREM